ncbi:MULTISPECIES: nickel pincer cofactor biosynthesis protein LarC [Acidobacteriaceae]|uniref:nickel pincer cofactor biosynthesis protein LarC n=1 Tax=Acidobacteriaceae TaxID=204434 RepID=UPI00131ABA52|nr:MULTISPECIES: nickel pincer cofactor biosynthesis protein LarC [Acidobacteriaceae]MDW5266418.1 nickel pincer cofactor biosynthesis protein LarC [Edaphobacter sp.]
MRIAYLDCFAGISGDMFLGALLDAGLAPQVLHEAIASLNLGASLEIEKTDRSGISSTRALVFDGTQIAEKNDSAHTHAEPHTHDKKPEEKAAPHHHGRHLSSIRKIIQSSTLADEVKQTAIRAFELLGASEAKIHNVDVEKIHFHEVGAIDAIVDIVAASAGIHALAVDQWFCSPLNVGGGSIDCAHGHFPVPAPATADLLRGLPTYSDSAAPQIELVTPTGAAILRALSPTFSQPPVMRVHRIGYGAGGRNPKGFPNVLRLNIGESAQAPVTDTATNAVTVLETALDDLNPQIIAHVAEQALQQGALDVMLTPVIMKKGRPGTLLTVLCDPEKSAALERLLLRETSTLGIRIHQQQRSCLDRSHHTVSTSYGEIRIKVGSLGHDEFKEELNANPEFEDCRAAAAAHNVPVKQVVQSAIAAYHSGKSK